MRSGGVQLRCPDRLLRDLGIRNGIARDLWASSSRTVRSSLSSRLSLRVGRHVGGGKPARRGERALSRPAHRADKMIGVQRASK